MSNDKPTGHTIPFNPRLDPPGEGVKMSNDREAFVRIWIQAKLNNEGVQWIAAQLGISHQAVTNRANYLRGRGVKLPKLLRNQIPDTEVTRLNRIVEKEISNVN
jgi:hypothetical protein